MVARSATEEVTVTSATLSDGGSLDTVTSTVALEGVLRVPHDDATMPMACSVHTTVVVK